MEIDIEKAVLGVLDKLRILPQNMPAIGEEPISKPRKRKSMFQIKKNVPLPKNRAGRPTQSKYPLSQMDAGDMFEVNTGYKPAARVRAAVYAAVKKYTTTEGKEKKFATRIINDKAVGVWRIK